MKMILAIKVTVRNYKVHVHVDSLLSPGSLVVGNSTDTLSLELPIPPPVLAETVTLYVESALNPLIYTLSLSPGTLTLADCLFLELGEYVIVY